MAARGMDPWFNQEALTSSFEAIFTMDNAWKQSGMVKDYI
jgi:hypothetical protein